MESAHSSQVTELFYCDTTQNKSNVSDDINLTSKPPISKVWISIYIILG